MICIEIYQKESRDDKKNTTGLKSKDFSAVSGRERGWAFVLSAVYFPLKPFYK
jgi:hypothetical protein